MPFPLIPVLVTAGLGGLGYALFHDTTPAAANGGAGTLGENTKPQNLPPAKRPADLPKPAPAPLPIPNVQPAPIPINPLPIPNVLPPPAPAPIPQPPLPLPVPTPVAPTTQTGVVVAPSGINLRKTPDATSTTNILYGMIAGTRVKINSYDPTPTTQAPKGWYNVTAPNGMTGYCTAEYLLPDNGSNPVPVPLPIPVPNVQPNVIPVSPVNPPSPSAPTMLGMVTGSPGNNLRAAPNENSAILTSVYKGGTVTVLSAALAPATPAAPKGWLNVKTSNGVTGWMARQYVQPIGDAVFGAESRRGKPDYAIRG